MLTVPQVETELAVICVLRTRTRFLTPATFHQTSTPTITNVNVSSQKAVPTTVNKARYDIEWNLCEKQNKFLLS